MSIASRKTIFAETGGLYAAKDTMEHRLVCQRLEAIPLPTTVNSQDLQQTLGLGRFYYAPRIVGSSSLHY